MYLGAIAQLRGIQEQGMNDHRRSGVLLHLTSIPTKYSIGDMGPKAYEFLDFITSSGLSIWQMLPVGPVGKSNSPYQSYSAFAGNHLLISPDLLLEEGILATADLPKEPNTKHQRTDYALARRIKSLILQKAFSRFTPTKDFESFCEEYSYWLDDYAMFMTLLELNNGRPWNLWHTDISRRDKTTLERLSREHKQRIMFHKFAQYLFFKQWFELKKACNSRGVKILGDLPIFVAHNSADVWAHPEIFKLKPDGNPRMIAGVPPDYFSSTGQLWGNPLYDWQMLEAQNYSWWIDRLKWSLKLFDMVRIDHFRGFCACWEVPYGETTAVNGRWVKVPGAKFFRTAIKALGSLPVIAEDLGVITPEVEALRDKFGFPGMKVLQFAFTNPQNQYLPHNYVTFNCVVYTGTHDNNTTLGWWEELDSKHKSIVRSYVGRKTGKDLVWELIRMGISSTAKYAIFPLQDFLTLGSEARMNIPGTEFGNWEWSYPESALSEEIAGRIKHLCKLYNRVPPEEKEQQITNPQ